MKIFEWQVSSARQVGEIENVIRRESKEKLIELRGAEAQIQSSEILTNHQEKLEVIKETINALLNYNIEQSKLQMNVQYERDKLESERYYQNLRFSKIAAWTSLIGALLGLISLIIKFVF